MHLPQFTLDKLFCFGFVINQFDRGTVFACMLALKDLRALRDNLIKAGIVPLNVWSDIEYPVHLYPFAVLNENGHCDNPRPTGVYHTLIKLPPTIPYKKSHGPGMDF